MSSSLKGYIAGLARILGVTPGALYERQRALVRSGLLPSEGGRGPGSGVRVTDSSVAMLLISMLATERLTDAGRRTDYVYRSKPVSGQCPLTGTKNFGSALETLLNSQHMSAILLLEISVSRTSDHARIRYEKFSGGALSRTSNECTVEFVGTNKKEAPIIVWATLSGDILREIAADVDSIMTAEIEDEEP
jgi:hypothetical protein